MSSCMGGKQNMAGKKAGRPSRSDKSVSANRKYKDTIFRMLYSDRKKLLSLYNAVSGKHYTNPDDLEIVTLENAIYMGMKNDLAFILDTELYLYEHQSTYNPNIPLRNLFYIAGEYQKLVDDRSLYSSAIQTIPTPNFVVFYNGTREMEDREICKLSAMYEHTTENPALELVVTMLNVNEGHNEELMEQCQTLREYAKYVARVRKYASQMELDDAVNRAVEECIAEGILEEFLRANKNEVVSVSIFEYDKEKEEKKLRKAEFEAGRTEGRQEGWKDGVREGEAHGVARGAFGMIGMCKELSMPDAQILEQLQQKLQITLSDAQKYLEMYQS